MQLVQQTLPGLSLLVNLNLDRLFTIGAILAGLLAGGFLGQILLGN